MECNWSVKAMPRQGRLIGGLRLPQLDEGGVLVAIENLVEEYNKRNKVEIEFRSNVAELNLAPILENTIFRIVQECLNNACRHSKSKKVKVELTQHDDQLRIEVQDWGVGFKVDRCGRRPFWLGGHPRAGQGFRGPRRHQEQFTQRNRHYRGVAPASCLTLSDSAKPNLPATPASAARPISSAAILP